MLRINVPRRLLAIAALPLLILSSGPLLRGSGWSEYAPALMIAVWIPMFVAIDGAAVVDRCGFRCRGCGYDLRGQITPRCPECGRGFDEVDRLAWEAASAAGQRRVRRSLGWVALAVMLILFFAAILAVGFTRWRTKSSRFVPPGRVSTQPTAAVNPP